MSEFVDKAMEQIETYAALLCKHGPDVADDKLPALRSHLECKEREHLATKALAKQLAEACKVAFDQTCSVGRPKDWEQLRAALAAYQEKT